MEAMKKDGFDTWLQDSLQDHESAIPMGGWQALHQAKKKKKRFGFLWMLAAGFVFLIGASAAYIHFNERSKLDSVTELQNPANKVTNEESAAAKIIDMPSIDDSPSMKEATHTGGKDDFEKVHGFTPNQIKKSNSFIPGLKAKRKASLIAPSTHPVDTFEVGTITVKKINPLLAKLQLNGVSAMLLDWSFSPKSSFKSSRRLYVQVASNYGEMHFRENMGTNSEANYSVILNQSNLNNTQLSLGAGIELPLLPHLTAFGGIHYERSHIKGILDYSFYTYSADPFVNTNQSWVGNSRLMENNYRYDISLISHRLMVPISLRYQLNYGRGLFFELGAQYSFLLKSQGNWINPEDLQPTTLNNNAGPKHHINPQFGFGYEFHLFGSGLALAYQYSPWSASFTPPNGKMGANQHGLKLQWQMPY